jgi:hypothetical protein
MLLYHHSAMSLTNIRGDSAEESNFVLAQLKKEVKRLKDRRSKIVEELDRKIGKLEGAIEVLEEEKGKTDDKQQSLIADSSSPTERAGYPSESTLRRKIIWALERKGEVMRPKQIDSILREREKDLRQNAVAETVSHMAKEGNLHRKKSGGRSHYYGLQDWKEKKGDDFKDVFLPEK